MATSDFVDNRQAAKGNAKAAAMEIMVGDTPAPALVPAPSRPSTLAAEQRRAARAREAVVARWLRRLNA